MTSATIDIPWRELPEMYTIKNDVLYFHFHKYQKQALKSTKRFILLLAGTQGGKTSFAPIWLYKEIREKGPGDYIFAAPTYKLMNLKAIPEFLKWFKTIFDLGEWKKAEKVFEISEVGEFKLWGAAQKGKTRILFGHAQDPDSLESATAKAAVLDECGQKKFKLGSFEAIIRRLSLFVGRVLMTTTPYYLGWLKQLFWDVWEKSNGNHPEIDIIRFPSIANPAFPREEYDRAQRELPRWKFDMFYNARFTRPAGMIYDCFDDSINKIPSFPIPDKWQRYLGVDFGGVNTAAVFLAQDPDSQRFYVYREYHAGGEVAKDHARKLKAGEPHLPATFGGARSEGQWRREFSAGGLPISRPFVSDLEIGIDRVYGAIKNNRVTVFDTCTGLLDEIASYSRQLDDMGQPTEKIEDKETYHRLDALRYIVSSVIFDTETEQVIDNPFFE